MLYGLSYPSVFVRLVTWAATWATKNWIIGVDVYLSGAKSVQTEIDNWLRLIEELNVEPVVVAFVSSAILFSKCKI